MPAERAGYTVTMFCIDLSPSMGKLRTVEVPDSQNGGTLTVEMTNLQWAMQYVLLKIQEMIFNGRKTDQCGVILFGTEETNNTVNDANGGYEHVYEYIPIAQPNHGTLEKLQKLAPSTEIGDPIDAIIVAVETQDKYLAKKKSWTRKLVLLTDGENPMEIEDWEVTVKKINTLNIMTTIVGIDFDDEEFGFKEEDKSDIKRENEKFFRRFIAALDDNLGMIGTAEHAIIECRRPDVKETKSVLMGTILRIGDVDTRPDEAIEVPVKMSKCTAIVRPPTMKKFAKRVQGVDGGEVPQSQESQSQRDGDTDEEKKDVYAQLVMQTEYLVNTKERHDEEDEEKGGEEEEEEGTTEKVDKDQLIRGFKYGASYAPCPDGQFPRLSTRKGMDICGFFPDDQVRRELAMGEVQYVWADPSSGESQVAFSSIVRAMLSRKLVAIARWVSRDQMDPKMGLLIPRELEKVDCLLWMQMPFADDVRKYTFPSLENLVNKKGEKVTKHPFLPSEEQMEAMERFVDDMDLMHAGDKDENGERGQWFDPRLSYNPAVHRIKQALFHAAVVTDLRENPLPPPHEEVVKYLNPPRRVVKKAQPALEECKNVFKVKQVPKRVLQRRKDGHVQAEDDDDELLLLDKPATEKSPSKATAASLINEKKPQAGMGGKSDKMDVDSETEPESGEEGDGRGAGEADAKRQMQLPSPEPSVINGHSNGTPHKVHDQSQSQIQSQSPFQTFTQSQSQSQSQSQPFDIDIDIGKPAGHLIGAARPLVDLKNALKDARGDEKMVKRAIDELGQVVNDVLGRPFAYRRYKELVDCLCELRVVCLKTGHVDDWNSNIQSTKETCLASTKINNKPFWEEIRNTGTNNPRIISIIGESEARQAGRRSKVSDEEAERFLQA